MIQDCYIEEIKDIVKEKKLHMSEQELYFAEREMQKNIIEYNMKIYAAALSAIERVTTYHFPREDADGNTVFYIIDCLQDGLQSFFWILPVKEEAIEAFHPCAKKWDRKHLLFGNITAEEFQNSYDISQQWN